MNIEEFFLKLRFDEAHHLGLGDVRLTLGQQDELIAAFKRPTETVELAPSDSLELIDGNNLHELERDAARYRWLRDNLDLLSEWMANDIPTSQFDRTIDANVKIDAALRQSAPSGEPSSDTREER